MIYVQLSIKGELDELDELESAANFRSSFYLADLHRKRLLDATKVLEWTQPSLLSSSLAWIEWLDAKAAESPEPRPRKVRVLINKAGAIRIEFAQVSNTTLEVLYPTELPRDKAPIYQIVLDAEATEFNILTWLKTTRRSMYDAARQRMAEKIKELQMDTSQSQHVETLLWNETGEIIEGSVTNVYFWRNGEWTTPFVGPACGGLQGTARTWALSQGLCKEGKILKDSVRMDELVWISNGVRGFLPGQIAWTGST
jgi:4-amino-4-deoxychorismate lyase